MNRVKFTHTGHSHLVGNFSAGDFFTGSPEACRHFVEEARCAEWHPKAVQAPAPAAEAEAKTQAETKTKAPKTPKAS
jgi:hypothetical protein